MRGSLAFKGLAFARAKEESAGSTTVNEGGAAVGRKDFKLRKTPRPPAAARQHASATSATAPDVVPGAPEALPLLEADKVESLREAELLEGTSTAHHVDGRTVEEQSARISCILQHLMIRVRSSGLSVLQRKLDAIRAQPRRSGDPCALETLVKNTQHQTARLVHRTKRDPPNLRTQKRF